LQGLEPPAAAPEAAQSLEILGGFVFAGAPPLLAGDADLASARQLNNSPGDHMTFTRSIFLALALLLPTSWTVARAGDKDNTGETKTDTKTQKKTKKSKKSDGSEETKTDTRTDTKTDTKTDKK
jgi:hypothetical protein